MKIGFACSWWRPREPTWSYIPISLRSGLLDAGANLVDIDAQPPLLLQAPVAGMLSLVQREPWKYHSYYRAIEAYRVRRAVAKEQPDVVLQLADLIVPNSARNYCYQDMNLLVAAEYRRQLGVEHVSAFPATPDRLRRVAQEQCQSMRAMDGIFVMGQWYKDFLVDRDIVAADKVHVVGGGIGPDHRIDDQRELRPSQDRSRLLFVGGDFLRKGGDSLLAALALIRREYLPNVTLTVAGPVKWPLPSPPPEGVEYLGALPRDETAKLFAQHDLFVLPSRFEAYGLVFLEARAHGLPCIGRDEFAMPELIELGVGGSLWRSESIEDLAELIVQALQDDDLHHRCVSAAGELWKKNQWSAVGERMLEHIDV